MHIMRHQPGVLPGIALRVVVLTMNSRERIERFAELTIGTDTAHKTCLLVEVLAITLGTLSKIFSIGLLAQQASHLSYTVIG